MAIGACLGAVSVLAFPAIACAISAGGVTMLALFKSKIFESPTGAGAGTLEIGIGIAVGGLAGVIGIIPANMFLPHTLTMAPFGSIAGVVLTLLFFTDNELSHKI